MKKKLLSLTLAAVLVLGIGNVVFAHGGSGDHHGWSFEEMMPFMKDMHPDMNDQQMKQMYENCHG